MMPYLLIIVTAVMLSFIIYLLPKRLTLIEIYSTTVFAILFNALVDVYLDLKLDLYGYFKKGADYEMILVLIGIFPFFNYLYLNGFPFMKRLRLKIGYIAVWTVIAVFYDWLAIQAKLLYFNNWTLVYSAIAYSLIYIILLINIIFIKWLRKKDSKVVKQPNV
ncbi:CBO0543 family protein [Ornithinibacillus contaminans]|uniref:CBO0543 family protein n=1 Tax=Ornithinibacillus contaminans TaxID=694055 RepID=UPI00069CE8B0|nr:CBO0543 family protein [Ornithinibacillus contaminans]